MPQARPKTPAASHRDHALLAAFRRELREFLAFSERAARGAGLPPQQHQALLAIEGLGGGRGMTVGELAGLLKVRHHSAVGLVNRMHAGGLVAKGRGRSDRREVLVRLTPRARVLMERLSAAHKAELRRIGPALSQILARLDFHP